MRKLYIFFLVRNPTVDPTFGKRFLLREKPFYEPEDILELFKLYQPQMFKP